MTEGESIQAAIDNATYCETINVGPGTYHENLHITQSVHLHGNNSTIVALVHDIPAIYVSAVHMEIKGFEITGSVKGIYTECYGHAYISNNTIHNNTINIDGKDVFDCWINNNTIRDAESHGIYLRNTSDICVFHNDVSRNGGYGGIIAYMCNDTSIYRNLIHDNVCRYGGITIYSTTWCDVAENQEWNNTNGIHVRYSDHCLFFDNIFASNGDSYNSHSNVWNIPFSYGPSIVGGTYAGGNYWSNYTGVDSDGNGVGDVPFQIPGSDEYDNYPITAPNCGDCDYNGYISANDVVLAYRKAVDPTYHINYEWVIDVDGNNYISANDVVEIYRRAVNPTYKLHCRIHTEGYTT
ncbi:MAG: NosD domain-containing protein [Euryarchaeota archaeon]|nr:NosD domain-containing protein [Euryarchaeota archaeon]